MIINVCDLSWKDYVGTLSFDDMSWDNNFAGPNGLFTETYFVSEINDICKDAIGSNFVGECRKEQAISVIEYVINMSKNNPNEFNQELISNPGFKRFECQTPEQSRGIAPVENVHLDIKELLRNLEEKLQASMDNIMKKLIGDNQSEKEFESRFEDKIKMIADLIAKLPENRIEEVIEVQFNEIGLLEGIKDLILEGIKDLISLSSIRNRIMDCYLSGRKDIHLEKCVEIAVAIENDVRMMNQK